MKNVKVKICGIRSLDSALAAVDAGADFLGFNLIPSSKRYIDPVAAQKIIKEIKGKIGVIGVFQNQKSEAINSIIDFLHLDYVQLHGLETPEFVRKIRTNVIKSFTTKTINTLDTYHVFYALIDREIQGQGDVVPEEIFKKNFSHPVFLSGGLTPENIGKILRAIYPFGVDVASGIETNGVEDVRKIKEFVRIAKGGFL